MIERHEVVRRNEFPIWLVGQPASGNAASRIEHHRDQEAVEHALALRMKSGSINIDVIPKEV